MNTDKESRKIKEALQKIANEEGYTKKTMMEAYLMGLEMGENKKALEYKKDRKKTMVYYTIIIIGFLCFFYMVFSAIIRKGVI